MSREEVVRLAKEAGFIPTPGGLLEGIVLRFAALVAQAKQDAMIADGWRQCAVGQKTTQHCALLESAVAAEREACARVCDELAELNKEAETDSAWQWAECAAAIRARNADK